MSMHHLRVLGWLALLGAGHLVTLHALLEGRASAEDGLPSAAAASRPASAAPPAPADLPEIRRSHLVDLLALGDAPTQAWAAERIVAEEAADWPDDHRGEFLRRIAPAVLLAASEHQIPPSVALAQAAWESDWGRSALAARYRNLFGIKALAGRRAVALPSAEHRDGRLVADTASFAVFESWEEAIDAHAALLAGPRYAKASVRWTSWRGFLRGIAPRYASDPEYARGVGSLVRELDLDRWDRLVWAVADTRATAPGDRSSPLRLDPDLLAAAGSTAR